MPIELDFRSPVHARKLTLVLLALGVLAGGASLVQRHHLLQLRESLHAQRGVQASPPLNAQAGAGKSQSADQARELREAIAVLQRPWLPMFRALRQALRPDIQITGLEQDTQATRWRISGVADSDAAFEDFLGRLHGDAGWTTVHPVSETRQTGPGTKPLSFQLLAEWRQP